MVNTVTQKKQWQHPLVIDTRCCVCSTVFTWYFAETTGQYWKDLELIGKDAIAFLTNTSFTKGDSSNMVIFDIDETLLSNITPYSEEALSQDDANGSSDSDQKHSKEKFAPALEAIKDVYLAAYAHGMSVCSPPPVLLQRYAHALRTLSFNQDGYGSSGVCLCYRDLC